MKDQREEVVTKICEVDKIVKSGIKWAGHNYGQNEKREDSEKS